MIAASGYLPFLAGNFLLFRFAIAQSFLRSNMSSFTKTIFVFDFHCHVNFSWNTLVTSTDGRFIRIFWTSASLPVGFRFERTVNFSYVIHSSLLCDRLQSSSARSRGCDFRSPVERQYYRPIDKDVSPRHGNMLSIIETSKASYFLLSIISTGTTICFHSYHWQISVDRPRQWASARPPRRWQRESCQRFIKACLRHYQYFTPRRRDREQFVAPMGVTGPLRSESLTACRNFWNIKWSADGYDCCSIATDIN